ncbi:MAG: endo alpha-1,4 polygalactosaminidase [Bacteroidota bacterium]|nr:endo alpha-1,4 polygalactosaminidase [Bacteroidota bacterium]
MWKISRIGFLLLLFFFIVSCEDKKENAVDADLYWTPLPQTSFQYQLSGTVDTTVTARVFDIDAFEATPELVARLHKMGKKVIGYISVGTYENWRPDTALFPKEVIGNVVEGWPGEKWLDIHQISKLAPVLKARLDMVKSKGFDAVEADNIDGYENLTGFAITQKEELVFAKWLADEAHNRGLSIGQKNASMLAGDLFSFYQWALVEDCFIYGECDFFQPYIEQKKAVFSVEYTDDSVDFDQYCMKADSLQFTGILKHRSLDSWLRSCH